METYSTNSKKKKKSLRNVRKVSQRKGKGKKGGRTLQWDYSSITGTYLNTNAQERGEWPPEDLVTAQGLHQAALGDPKKAANYWRKA